MLVYISATIIAALLMYKIRKVNTVDNSKEIKKKIGYKLLVIGSFLPLFIVSAIRFDVGTDYSYIYIPLFERLATPGEWFQDVGFALLNKFVLLFTTDYIWIFIITSFLFCFFVYYAIMRLSVNTFQSVILIVITSIFFGSLNIVRQSIAMAILIYAIKFIKERELIKYIIFCLIAASMHSTALIMLPLYFVLDKNISAKVQFVIVIATVVLIPVLEQVLPSLIALTRYDWYYDTTYNGQTVTSLYFVNIAVFLVGLFYKNKVQDSKYYNILCNIQFLATIVVCLSPIIPLSFRLIRYFTIFHILYIPEIIKAEKRKDFRMLLSIGIFIAYTALMYYQIFYLGGEAVLPYRTIFEGV